MQYKFFISQNHACTFAQFENFILNANLLIIVDVSRACNPSSLYIMSEILLLNLVLGCGNIPKISFEISDDLFEDLKVHALQTESGCTDLIVEYIEQGLNLSGLKKPEILRPCLLFHQSVSIHNDI